MTSDDAKRLRAEIEEIERGAMSDQRGWMEYLNRQSDRGREEHLRTLLPLAKFERWRALRLMLTEAYTA
jgi:hypothetical protein